MQTTQLVRARWEYKLADLWIGIFVRLGYPDFDADQVHKVVHIWICFIPCFPLHLQVVLGTRWYASWWLLRTRCDSETWLNTWERWFYALKALWCLWMRPAQRAKNDATDEIIAAIWNVYAGGDYHAWDQVTVGSGVFRNWWAGTYHESE